jgi:hypothetical protein
VTLASGCAYRFAHPAHAAVPRDVARVIDDGDVVLAVLASGSDHGFSRTWPRGSSMLLDRIDEVWRTDTTWQARAADLASPLLEVRLTTAIELAVDAYLRDAAVPIDQANDPDLGGADGSLVAVALPRADPGTEARARPALALWVGREQAVVVRAGAIVARTAPHTLAELAREKGYDRYREVPRIATRSLATDRHSGTAPDLRWLGVLGAGDWCILLSADLAHELDDTELADALASSPTPQALAETLVAREMDDAHAPLAAACAIRW